MLDEIFEQPLILSNILKRYIDKEEKRVIFPQLMTSEARLKKIKRVELLGCGTSYHAAMLGNYYFEELAEINAETEFADEFDARQPVIDPETLIIAISQSGETTDVLKAAGIAKDKGAFLVSITNGQQSSLAKISDVIVYNEAGIEKALAATKTFTTQVLILLLLALYIGRLKGRIFEEHIETLLMALPDQIEEVLSSVNKIEAVARKFIDFNNIFVLGERFEYPIAMEGAHKIKETAYLQSQGYPTGELKHGAMALIDEEMLVIFITPFDEFFEHNINLLKEVVTIGTNTLVITNKHKNDSEHKANEVIYVPSSFPVIQPLSIAVVLQLLAYYFALHRGLDVDKPRNLKKFVV